MVGKKKHPIAPFETSLEGSLIAAERGGQKCTKFFALFYFSEWPAQFLGRLVVEDDEVDEDAAVWGMQWKEALWCGSGPSEALTCSALDRRCVVFRLLGRTRFGAGGCSAPPAASEQGRR